MGVGRVSDDTAGGVAATALFVEVLVVGAGAAAALALAAAVLVGPAPVTQALTAAGAPVALLVTAVSYVSGIVVDRAADALFRPASRRLRARSFDDRAAYDRARLVVDDLPGVAARAAYARSRLRVCRGWALDAAALVLLLQAYAFVRAGSLPPEVLPAGWVMGTAFVVGCVAAWRSLARNGYQRLARQTAPPDRSEPPAD